MNKPSRKRKLVDRYALWDSLRRWLNYAILPFFVVVTVGLTLIILQAGISNVTGLEIYLFLVCSLCANEDETTPLRSLGYNKKQRSVRKCLKINMTE